MDAQRRLVAALQRITAATSAHRSQAADTARAARNGTEREDRLEAAVIRLELVADELERLVKRSEGLRAA